MTHLSFFLSYTRSHYSLKQSGCKLEIRTLLLCNGSNSLNLPNKTVFNALYMALRITQRYATIVITGTSPVNTLRDIKGLTRGAVVSKIYRYSVRTQTYGRENCVQTFPHRKGKHLCGGDFMLGRKLICATLHKISIHRRAQPVSAG